eukprot:GHVN01052577.1.p1 GENE.GHVN01052577.1~~GHVN01052577.1.p1  ORF type:complete len:101 (+),score=10.07 GHVN01052577.1:150-452(+)
MEMEGVKEEGEVPATPTRRTIKIKRRRTKPACQDTDSPFRSRLSTLNPNVDTAKVDLLEKLLQKLKEPNLQLFEKIVATATLAVCQDVLQETLVDYLLPT